jgi:hypothetical protein
VTTGEIVRDKAMELARSQTDHEQAVAELMAACEGRRVAVVRARQELVAWLDSESDQKDAMRATEFLDDVLERLPTET